MGNTVENNLFIIEGNGSNGSYFLLGVTKGNITTYNFIDEEEAEALLEDGVPKVFEEREGSGIDRK